MQLVRRSLLALCALTLTAGVAQAGGVSAEADASRPFVVKVHADWCGTCTRLNATWAQLQSELGSGARLVILDVTDRETLAASMAEAKRLGLESFFAQYKSKTGTIGILRGDDRTTVETLKGVTDTAPYQTAVAKAKGMGAS